MIAEAARLNAVADWHAEEATRAYQFDRLNAYARHVAIADHLRRRAWLLQRRGV